MTNMHKRYWLKKASCETFSGITGILLTKYLHWANSTFTKILKSDICKGKCMACMAAEISTLSVTFLIKLNLVRWWNASINVVLFYPRQFSFYKATQFLFIKIDNQIWLKQNMYFKLSIGKILL